MPRTGRPKSENPKSAKLTVRIEPELRDKFNDVCESTKINASELIRQWILEFLENKKK